MAAEDGFSIDVPAVLGIAAKVGSLTSASSSTASALGSAVLDGTSFGSIGSELASINSALEQQTGSALQQLMRLFGQTNGSVSTAATGYADLDRQIATLLGGGTTTTALATGPAVDDGLNSLTHAGSPSAVRQRWNDLTPEQQQQLIANHPNEIGTMNGIPVTARDQANRRVLGTMQQQAQRELDGAKSDLADGARQGDLSAMLAAQSHVEASQRQVAALQQLHTVIGNGSSQQYLLGVNQNGPGQWIVASGNPDTAQHIVTLVPGMATTLTKDSIGTQATHAANLLAASNHAAPGESTSVITWAGYHSPQNIQALSPSYAQAGAPALQSFQQGLYATHDSAPFTTTVAAHSYGTVVATDAATAPGGLRTDALAYLDSPGVPATSAASLGIRHVFATATTNDAVVHGSDFVGRLGAYEYNGNLGAGMSPILNPQDQAFHGADPLSSSFGATTFDAGTGTPGILHSITAHSDVFNPAYPGPANVGKIVTGHYGEITPRR